MTYFRRFEQMSVLSSHRKTILCLLLVLATLAAYAPAFRSGFVNYDDLQYVTQNTHIHAGLTWNATRWAMSAFYQSNWHPLTWMSHALDISLFHLNPIGHHAMNVILHALNAVMLFLVLESTTQRIWESFVVAALFALHPVNVESVAWIAERKNVLSMFFLLAALYAYGKYARRPSFSGYAAVAVLFALGLTAKPQIITLPFLLLLWDVWPLERWNPPDSMQQTNKLGAVPRRLIYLCVEKLPLFFLSLASAIVTLRAQMQGGALQRMTAEGYTVAAYPFLVRLENAVVAYGRYLATALWPLGLAPLYPHPGNTIGAGRVAIFGVMLLSITVAVFAARRRHRFLLVGWLWFLGTLVPMIGMVQVGAQAMADRYAYLAFIGLFFSMVWGVSALLEGWLTARRVVAVGTAGMLVAMGILAYRQAGFWRDSEVLWSHTLQVTKRNFIAHDALASHLLAMGRFTEGCPHFQASVSIFPDDMPAQEGLAVCAQERGDSKEAIQRYENVLRLAAESGLRSIAFANMGSIYRTSGNYVRARENYEAALQLNPDLPIALVGMGLLAQKGWDYSRAATQYAHAMSVEPTSVGYLLLAKALEQGRRPDEAKEAFERARTLSHNLQADQKVANDLMSQ